MIKREKAYGTPIRCAFADTGACSDDLPQRQVADIFTHLGDIVGTITVWACEAHDDDLARVAREEGIEMAEEHDD